MLGWGMEMELLEAVRRVAVCHGAVSFGRHHFESGAKIDEGAIDDPVRFDVEIWPNGRDVLVYLSVSSGLANSTGCIPMLMGDWFMPLSQVSYAGFNLCHTNGPLS